MYTIEQLDDKLLSELREIAETLAISNSKKLPKQELVYKILDAQAVKPVSIAPEKIEKKEPISKVVEEKKEDMTDPSKRRPRVKRENVKEVENTFELKNEDAPK